jgi:hypothetical protein
MGDTSNDALTIPLVLYQVWRADGGCHAGEICNKMPELNVMRRVRIVIEDKG